MKVKINFMEELTWALKGRKVRSCKETLDHNCQQRLLVSCQCLRNSLYLWSRPDTMQASRTQGETGDIDFKNVFYLTQYIQILSLHIISVKFVNDIFTLYFLVISLTVGVYFITAYLDGNQPHFRCSVATVASTYPMG